MKTPTFAFSVVLALTLGACASTQASETAGRTASGGLVASSSSGSSHHDTTAIAVDGDREIVGAAIRGDRGVPTPQPAREAFAEIPVPQPPIPAVPERHGNGYNSAGRY